MFDTDPALNARLAALCHPGLKSIEPGLERMQRLLARLGHPERKLPPVVHIAGTNGKGSTLAFLRAMLEAAGYRVHAYTSPHLVRFHERIRVADELVGDAQLHALLDRIEAVTSEEPATFFEATTAMAYLAFAETRADIVLLETGMGGRWDATNAIEKPALTVITPIGIDHAEYLGDTLAKVAFEKAGIMKRGAACICAAQPEEALAVLKQRAEILGAPLSVLGQDFGMDGIGELALAGAHQRTNAALARQAARQLRAAGFNRLDEAAIAAGLLRADWPGRLQRLPHKGVFAAVPERIPLWLDGGHNPHAAQALVPWLRQQAEPRLVWGMLKDKDAAGYIAALAPYLAQIVTVPVPDANGYAPFELAAIARRQGVESQPVTGVVEALAGLEKGTVLIAGSLYLAGWCLAEINKG